MSLRFYNPDGVVVSSSIYGTAGHYDNTFYSNANQAQMNTTFGQSLANGRDLQLEMTILSSSTNRQAIGGSYSLTQRKAAPSYAATYCQGNFYLGRGTVVNTDLMFFNGVQDQSGNTWADAMLTVLGMGDNTS